MSGRSRHRCRPPIRLRRPPLPPARRQARLRSAACSAPRRHYSCPQSSTDIPTGCAVAAATVFCIQSLRSPGERPHERNVGPTVSALVIATIVFACVAAGAVAGLFLRGLLPPHHLGEDTKDVVRLA